MNDINEQSNIKESCKLIMSFLGVVRHVRACPKFSKIANCKYLTKELSDCLNFLHGVRHTWKLQISCFFSCVLLSIILNNKLRNTCGKCQVIFLVLCMQLDIHGNQELILSLQLAVIRRAQLYLKYFEIPNLQNNHCLILDLLLNGEFS